MEVRIPPKPYAPLIWLLVAIITGFALAEFLPTTESTGIKLVLIAISIFAAVWTRRSYRWRFYLLLAATVGANLYYGAIASRNIPPDGQRAPHEITVEMQILQRFALKEDSDTTAGIARIKSAPNQAVVGQKVAYMMRWDLKSPCERGQTIRACGILRGVQKTDGFEGYLWGQHVPYRLERAYAQKIVHTNSPWMHAVEVSRRWVIATLERGHPYGEGLLPAMVMGAKAEMSKDQTQDFIRSGTYHLVAVSGMNVMVVAALLWLIGRALRLPLIIQSVAVVGVLYFYAQLTGASPSVMRAWGMVSIVVGALLLRQQANLWPITVLTAITSLLIEPLSLFHGGWRLSFGVVAGLVLGMAAVERRWRTRWPKGVYGSILSAVVVSFVAALAVAPMTAAYWGLAQPFGFLLNAVAVFLAGWITLIGSASILVGAFAVLPELLNQLAGGLIWLTQWAIKGYLACPLAVCELNLPGWFDWVGTVLILLAFYLLATMAPKRLPHN